MNGAEVVYNDEKDVRSLLDSLRDLLPPDSRGYDRIGPERAEKGAEIR